MQRVGPTHPQKKKKFPSPYFYSGFERRVVPSNRENKRLHLLTEWLLYTSYHAKNITLSISIALTSLVCLEKVNCANIPARRNRKLGQVHLTPKHHALNGVLPLPLEVSFSSIDKRLFVQITDTWRCWPLSPGLLHHVASCGPSHQMSLIPATVAWEDRENQIAMQPIFS